MGEVADEDEAAINMPSSTPESPRAMPCPWCKYEGVSVLYGVKWPDASHRPTCDACGACGPAYAKEASAIAAWNEVAALRARAEAAEAELKRALAGLILAEDSLRSHGIAMAGALVKPIERTRAALQGPTLGGPRAEGARP